MSSDDGDEYVEVTPTAGLPPELKPDPEPPKQPKVKKKRQKVTAVVGRLTQYEILERRRQVAALRMRGLGIQQIAKLLNVSEPTVSKDLSHVQEENAKRITDFEKERYIGEGLAHFDELKQRAWAEYYGAAETRHKLKALDVLRSIQKDALDSLVATGVIVKPKEQPVQVEHEHKHTLQLDWSQEMKEKAAQALLQLSLRSTLAEPTPEALPPVMEAEVVVETGTSDEPEPPSEK